MRSNLSLFLLLPLPVTVCKLMRMSSLDYRSRSHAVRRGCWRALQGERRVVAPPLLPVKLLSHPHLPSQRHNDDDSSTTCHGSTCFNLSFAVLELASLRSSTMELACPDCITSRLCISKVMLRVHRLWPVAIAVTILSPGSRRPIFPILRPVVYHTTGHSYHV